jgi:predicted O-methyltransferase YrrM
VYDFVERVLNDRRRPESFARIEAHRERLRRSGEMLDVLDFGAGSAFGTTSRRSVGSIARHAAKPSKYGRLLYRIAEYYRCRKVLELGTSLGISTAYLASAPGVGRVLTLEGSPAIADAAGKGFAALGLRQVEQLVGNFDDTLEEALIRMPKPDLVFIDGNHREEPTVRYFRQCLAAAHEETILVFDDIHWSAGMESAWAQIKADPAVRCTIDLFFVGVVLLRSAFREKQHFVIRY